MDKKLRRPEPKIIEVISRKIIKDYGLRGSVHNTKIQDRTIYDKSNIVYIKNPKYVTSSYKDEESHYIALTEDEYRTIEMLLT
jgi:hypothetical protein